MYLTIKQELKHLSKDEYKILRELCHTAKNLKNQAIYNIRQNYFNNGKYLSYCDNYKLLKTSSNYKKLNSNMSQQLLKKVDSDFKSFFGLLKLAKKGEYSYKSCKMPHYLPKDGYSSLIIEFVRISGNQFLLPYSNLYRKNHKNVIINIPPILVNKNIKEIKIVPKANARFFEIHYSYEEDCIKRNFNNNNALAIDLGVNNLMTVVTSKGNSFIIDGKKIKSINQWFNKENARLQSIKDKQNFGKSITKKQSILFNKRRKRINDYISKSAKLVIDYCLKNDISIIVIGKNKDFQNKTNIGKANNQNFVNIPYGELCNKLKYLCELNDIEYIEQEESYTSKASFFDKDDIPVYDKNNTQTYTFSGKRIHRGMYQCLNGKTLNADVNGALNILRKSKVVSLEGLYNRGDVDTPTRIRIA